ACINKILLSRRPKGGGKLGLLPHKPLQLVIEGAIGGYVLFAAHLVSRIAVDQLPSILIESPDPSRDLGELLGRASVVQSRSSLEVAAKLSGIKHGLTDHLEDFVFEDMRADPRVAASFDPCPVVRVFLRLAIAAVHSAMIDGHLAGGLYNLVVSPR